MHSVSDLAGRALHQTVDLLAYWESATRHMQRMQAVQRRLRAMLAPADLEHVDGCESPLGDRFRRAMQMEERAEILARSIARLGGRVPLAALQLQTPASLPPAKHEAIVALRCEIVRDAVHALFDELGLMPALTGPFDGKSIDRCQRQLQRVDPLMDAVQAAVIASLEGVAT